MKFLLPATLSLLISLSILDAQTKDEKFLAAVTNPDVKGLAAPTPSDDISLYDFDIQTSDQETYKLIQQGVGHLLGIWDFEAYRFFIEALKREPQSIMATCGILLSTLSSDYHFDDNFEVAHKRLKALLKNPEIGSTFEQNFGNAVLKLINQDLVGWKIDLSKMVSARAEGWKLPALLQAYFQRDGYTAMGDPRLNQHKAVKSLRQYCLENPDDPASLVFLVTAQMDNPKLRTSYINEVLPCARKLVRLYPKSPSYRYVLAYCEFRSGDPFLAEQTYREAEALFLEYIQTNKVKMRNVPNLMNCKIGIISSLVLQQDYAKALAETDALTKLKLETYETPSRIHAVQRWEADSFRLRIGLAANDQVLLATEIERMHQKLMKIPKGEWQPHHHFWHSLLLYSTCRQMIMTKDMANFNENLQLMKDSNAKLFKTYYQAIENNEKECWIRATNTLIMLNHELNARHELTRTPVPQVNFNSSIAAAIDGQVFCKNFMPPLWLEPVEMLKAKNLLSIGELDEALISIDRAYGRMPNHIPTTRLLEKILRAQERNTEADQVSAFIQKFNAKRNK